MSFEPVLLDTDTLSEVLKGRNSTIQLWADAYLDQYGELQFSIITRFEVLRGLMAKDAVRQISEFYQRCDESFIFPLTDDVVDRASSIYGFLRKRGRLIDDCDILIAATAQVHGLPLVTGNLDDFGRIPGIHLETWHKP